MRIILDSSGLDKGPITAIKAGERAKKELNIDVTVVGLQSLEKDVLDHGLKFLRADSEITPNDENPAFTIRKKKDSTIVRGLTALKNDEYDAFVSAGSTGAVLAGGMVIVGRIKGVERAALIAPIPTKKGYITMLDIGANVDPTPDMLLSFAIMAKNYVESIKNIKNPKIALLNNGAEEHKGTELTKETFKLLKNSDLNFVGNLEARYIFDGDVDIVLTDGFSGNLFIKAMEGQIRFVKHILSNLAKDSFLAKIGLLLIKNPLKKKMESLDASKYGGVPLLGLKKPVIKAHGNSSEEAIFNSIRVAKEVYESDMILNIENSFKKEN